MLTWLIFSILAALGTGFWGITLQKKKHIISKSLLYNFIYILLVFISVGIISLIACAIAYYFASKKEIKIFEGINWDIIGILALILFSYQTCIIIAYSFGGGIVQSIINLNAVIAVIGSYYLYGQALNIYEIIGIIVSLIGVTTIVYGKEVIRKQ